MRALEPGSLAGRPSLPLTGSQWPRSQQLLWPSGAGGGQERRLPHAELRRSGRRRAERSTCPGTRSVKPRVMVMTRGQKGCLAGAGYSETRPHVAPRTSPLCPRRVQPFLLSQPEQAPNKDAAAVGTACSQLLPPPGSPPELELQGALAWERGTPVAREATLLFKAARGEGSPRSEHSLQQQPLWAPSPHLLPPRVYPHSEDYMRSSSQYSAWHNAGLFICLLVHSRIQSIHRASICSFTKYLLSAISAYNGISSLSPILPVLVPCPQAPAAKSHRSEQRWNQEAA